MFQALFIPNIFKIFLSVLLYILNYRLLCIMVYINEKYFGKNDEKSYWQEIADERNKQ
jgi:hypothetical protein